MVTPFFIQKIKLYYMKKYTNEIEKKINEW